MNHIDEQLLRETIKVLKAHSMGRSGTLLERIEGRLKTITKLKDKQKAKALAEKQHPKETENGAE
jgi:hypothetical protein